MRIIERVYSKREVLEPYNFIKARRIIALKKENKFRNTCPIQSYGLNRGHEVRPEEEKAEHF